MDCAAFQETWDQLFRIYSIHQVEFKEIIVQTESFNIYNINELIVQSVSISE